MKYRCCEIRGDIVLKICQKNRFEPLTNHVAFRKILLGHDKKSSRPRSFHGLTCTGDPWPALVCSTRCIEYALFYQKNIHGGGEINKCRFLAGIFHYPRIRASRTRVINQRHSQRSYRKINELLRSFIRPSKLRGHRVYHRRHPSLHLHDSWNVEKRECERERERERSERKLD